MYYLFIQGQLNMTDQHRPRKRFGQHFLRDYGTVQHIVTAINPHKDDHVVEIGPGLGVLTEKLLPWVDKLDAVELDRDLVPKLQATYLPLGNFSIHSADALRFDYCALASGKEKLRIVGNLPYNISTPLIFHLIAQIHCIKDMHFMLQKEVVDRLAAQPNCSDYGKLSIMIQYHCQVHSLFNVPPDAFSPPPKVDSSIVRLVPHPRPPVQVNDLATFEKLVSSAFAQRRKTLRNNLKDWLSESQWQTAGIDPQRRAETLSLEEFARLALVLDKA
jgi:16S rRNA (adenine1518-N6/adenine1519-N6)-dimethyltransferase